MQVAEPMFLTIPGFGANAASGAYRVRRGCIDCDKLPILRPFFGRSPYGRAEEGVAWMPYICLSCTYRCV